MRAFKLLLASLVIATAASAQTITWTAAGNPYVINGTYTVPAGQTLVLGPGVIININPHSTLQVNGEVMGNGTGANRITINGAENYSSLVKVPGTINLSFTNVRAQVRPFLGGTMLFADCNFSGNGTIFNPDVALGPG
ncbi:hypothetical protein BH20VER1_BH20VER1_27740 [soil metagenome]